MENEAARWLYRPAIVNRRVRRFAGVDIQFLKDLVQPHAFAQVPQPEAEGAVLVMGDHGDNRMIKARVTHPGHGEQQAACEELRFRHGRRLAQPRAGVNLP